MVSPDEIAAAAGRIGRYVRRTPLLRLEAPVPCEVKLETLQHAGSFKVRGVLNALLSGPLPEAGVAAPGGNLGAAAAFAALALRRPAHIFVPGRATRAAFAAAEASLPDIHFGGDTEADAGAACAAFRARTGATGPTRDAATIAGYGTVGAEWEADSDGVDTVLVAVSSGALAAGVAAWFGPRVRVVGARSDAPAAAALVPPSVAVVRVPEGAILDAQQALWRVARIVAEPAGALAYAALLSGAYTPAPGERVGVLVGGGNVDPAAFALLAG